MSKLTWPDMQKIRRALTEAGKLPPPAIEFDPTGSSGDAAILLRGAPSHLVSGWKGVCEIMNIMELEFLNNWQKPGAKVFWPPWLPALHEPAPPTPEELADQAAERAAIEDVEREEERRAKERQQGAA